MPLSVAGTDVHVDGDAAQVIVMLHGWPDTYRLWDVSVEALKPHYKCVRFTLLGFEAGSPRRAYSLEETLELIYQVVKATSPDRPVILMAHDWGCLFGYQFALAHPALVSRMIGLDIGDAGSRDHLRSLGLGGKMASFGYQVWLAAAWRIGGAVGDRMSRFMARQLRVPGDVSRVSSGMNYPYYIQWTGAHGSYRAARRFKPIVPTLFIYGSKKPYMFHSPEWAAEIANQPPSQVTALEAGHWMMLDKPGQFNRAVLTWLQGLANEASK